MRTFVWVAVLSLSIIILSSGLSAQVQKGPFYYLSPLPGAEQVVPAKTILLRPEQGLVQSGGDWTSRVAVVGESSGPHAGAWKQSRDGRTFIFVPAVPFEYDERVSVTLAGNGSVQGFSYSFRVAGGPSRPDPMGLEMLCECVGAHSKERRTPIDTGTHPGRRHNRWGFELPPDFPNIQVTQSGPQTPGHIFISNFGWPPNDPSPDDPGRYFMILDNDGIPVFFRRAQGLFAIDFKVLADGLLSYYDFPRPVFNVLDDTYKLVKELTTINYPPDFHDLILLDNGNYLITAHDNQRVDMSEIVEGGHPDAVVVEFVIQEIDPDNNVVFEWNSTPYFDVMDATHFDLTQERVDYIHTNSLHVDDDGHIIMSNRHMDEVTKISRDTGEIIWRLGGKNNQFQMLGGGQWFSHQHSARRQSGGTITIFDNGNFSTPQESRAVEYELDEVNMTIAQVWEYRNDTAQFGSALGNVQRMDNGNTLVGWGSSNPNITEVRPDGSEAFELSFDDGVVSYRGFRFEWNGKAAAPVMWLEQVGNDVTLHFTRFGPERWTRYRIYQGDTPETMQPIGKTMRNRFHVDGLRPGKSYFKVTAIEHFWDESEPSNVDSAEVTLSTAAATVSIHPKTINLDSHGRWITARIEMGEDCGCDARDIDVASLRLNGVVRPVPFWFSYRDYNHNGVRELKVKFSRRQVAETLTPGESVPIEISGVAGDSYFEAVDYIRVIGSDRDDSPLGASNLTRSTMGRNLPNPFNPSTVIPYQVAEPNARVVVTIFDASGRRVRTLVDGPQTTGAHTVEWHGRDSQGNTVASGVYFVQFRTGSVAETRKLILLK